MSLKSCIGALAVLCMLVISGCSILEKQPITVWQRPSPPDVSEAIELSITYLVNATKQDGQFIYSVNRQYWMQANTKYNILHHAGVLHALVDAYQYRPDEELLSAILNASHFLKSRSMAPVAGRDDMLGIWTLPLGRAADTPRQIKLGATGLGLAALVGVEQLKSETTPLSDLRKLGRFLLYMQRPDGSFYAKFIPSEGGKSDRWTSLYYPGEAALGLLMLNDIDPDRRWLDAATKALAHLIRHHDSTTVDQWLLIAAAKLLSIKEYPATLLPRKRIIQYTTRVCERILEEQILYAGNSKYVGGYSTDGRTTPTAIRIEGLYAALNILGDRDPILSNTISSSIQEAMDFLLQAQIAKGRYIGGMPRTVATSPGRRNSRSGEIRIDYVQHALNAMIQYKVTPRKSPGAS